MIEKLMKLMLATLALAIKGPDESVAVKKNLGELETLISGEDFKSLGNVAQVKEIQANYEQMKKSVGDIDVEMKRIQKAGLLFKGGVIVDPAGQTARRQMIRDKRCFLSDGQAKRFGAYAVCEIAKTRPGIFDTLPKEVQELGNAVAKDNNMDPGVAASGGAAIPNEFRQGIIRNVEVEGTVFPLCQRVPLFTLGTTNWLRETGGMTAYWSAAAASVAMTKAAQDLVSLAPKKLMTLVGCPNEFFRSSALVEIGNYIGLAIVRCMVQKIDDSVVNGDGSAAYGEITGLLVDATIGSVIATAGHTTMATVDYNDWTDIASSMPVAYALDNARFVMSVTVKGKARKQRSAVGGWPIFERGSNGEPNTIDDYPYTIATRMPASAAIAANNPYALFGDFRRAMMVGMLQDIRIDSSDQALFVNDMTVFRAIAHLDAKLTDANSMLKAQTAP